MVLQKYSPTTCARANPLNLPRRSARVYSPRPYTSHYTMPCLCAYIVCGPRCTLKVPYHAIGCPHRRGMTNDRILSFTLFDPLQLLLSDDKLLVWFNWHVFGRRTLRYQSMSASPIEHDQIALCSILEGRIEGVAKGETDVMCRCLHTSFQVDQVIHIMK